MLTRMYNLSLHTDLPLMDVPFSWVLFWSRLLEHDLTEQRLRQMNQKQARASKGRMKL